MGTESDELIGYVLLDIFLEDTLQGSRGLEGLDAPRFPPSVPWI